MTTYTVQAPDDRHYTIEAPNGASEQEALEWFESQWDAGSVTPDQASKQEVKGDVSTFREFQYGFESTPTDVQNAALWLESRFPLGEISLEHGYLSPNEIYGEGFEEMSPDQRRQFLLSRRQEQIKAEFGDVIEAGATDTPATLTGSIFGTLATPTTLAPVGKGYKAAAMVGGMLGAEHSALDQLAKTGEVGPLETAKYAALGTVAAPLTLAVGRGVGNAVTKVKVARAEKNAITSANKLIDNVNERVAVAVNAKTPIKDLSKVVEKQLGVTVDEVVQASKVAGRKPVVPTPREAKIVTEALQLKAAPAQGKSKLAFIDDYLGNLSTRVKNISEPVFGRLRKYEFDSHVKTHEVLKKVDPFLTGMKKLPPKVQNLLSKQLANGDFGDAKALLRRFNPQLIKEFNNVQNVLEGMYTQLQEAGYTTLGKIPNYFPRYVKDVPSLLSRFGKTEQAIVEKALKEKAKQLGLKSINAIPEESRADVVNKVLRGYLPRLKEGQLGFSKARSIERLTDDMLEDYASPAEALHTYLTRATNDIEKRKFFGRGAASKDGKIDLEESVGNFVQKEISSGNLTLDQADSLSNLLRARFGLGEQSPHKVIQDMRNIGYTTTITNPYSALTQLGDVGVATYLNGIRNTMSALLGKKRVRMEDFGLDDIIAEELGTTAKALHKLFTLSGFRSIDKFGKSTLLNGALNKANKLAKSPKGTEQLRQKYGKVFGEEFKGLVDDLNNGKVTENVKLYLWNELSDAQPISLSEMPVKYLEAPNGRIFYSLKTYALKQLDILRRDIAQEWAKGNKTQALRNATRYATLVPLMGATVDEAKDFMTGKGMSIEDIPDNYIENLFKTFGATEYVRDKYLGEGKLASALGEVMSPPISWIDAIGTDIWNIASGEEDYPKEVMRELPLIGKFWYNFFGGGIERAEEKEMQELFEE
jgi:hypothetical protein